ncbi:prolipoprotein diacylglyceryl transferase [Candidatus Gracilibacteria bacterium]|nr:prolipoprotein diacylglyceryl transferase [Candidatus Gracilibacteria bacterium]
MFPFIEILPGFTLYTFGLSLVICFFLFLGMFRKLANRFKYNTDIIEKNLLWYVLGIFIGSRLFYVIAKWSDLKYIRNPFEFFLMNDYNFSLLGGIVGFFVVFYILLKKKKETIDNYIDGIITSLLFILPVGYVGALLGGQVYGRETHIGIEILYSHPFTPVPFEIAIFPLPIVYAGVFFLLFCGAYIGSLFIHTKSFIGYIGALAACCVLLIFEFFSGKYDIFKDTVGVNIIQIGSILCIAWCVHHLYHRFKKV